MTTKDTKKLEGDKHIIIGQPSSVKACSDLKHHFLQKYKNLHYVKKKNWIMLAKEEILLMRNVAKIRPWQVLI